MVAGPHKRRGAAGTSSAAAEVQEAPRPVRGTAAASPAGQAKPWPKALPRLLDHARRLLSGIDRVNWRRMALPIRGHSHRNSRDSAEAWAHKPLTAKSGLLCHVLASPFVASSGNIW